MKLLHYLFTRTIIETSQFIYTVTIITAIIGTCYTGWKEISGTAHESFKSIHHQVNHTSLPSGNIELLSTR